MARKAGSADLPLHGGHVPKWLADRMTRLGPVISEAIVHHYGRDVFSVSYGGTSFPTLCRRCSFKVPFPLLDDDYRGDPVFSWCWHTAQHPELGQHHGLGAKPVSDRLLHRPDPRRVPVSHHPGNEPARRRYATRSIRVWPDGCNGQRHPLT